MRRKQFSALVVGAGRIGAGFDSPESKRVITHAHAYLHHPGFKLVGFVDTDKKQAIRAVKKWGGEAFEDLHTVFCRKKIDVVSVAVPDEFHYSVLMELAKLPVKLVMTEKPLAISMGQAKKLVSSYKRKQIPLAVNYTRRFVPEFIRLRDEIKNKKYGEYLAGTGYYEKGLVHNGSHLIDLIRYLVGTPGNMRAFEKKESAIKGDPTISGVVRLVNERSFVLWGLESKLYSKTEMDLWFEKARIRMLELGDVIEYALPQNSQVFAGYTYLTKRIRVKTKYLEAMKYTVDNIYKFLLGQEKLICDGEDALETLKICARLIG